MIWMDGARAQSLMPAQATVIASRVNNLYSFLLVASFISCVILIGGMIYFAWKYKRRSDNDQTPYISHNTTLEFLWSFIPLVIFLAMFAWGWVLYHDMREMPKDALEIHILAKQWAWESQYKSGVRAANLVVAPVNTDVKLIMTSQDVIHSFYVPAFRLKRDALPYQQTEAWFEATKTGTYHLLCSEYCGTDHSRMLGRVIVMEPQDYAQWLTKQPERDGLAELGERLFSERGCSGCHNAGSKVHAPSLAGIWGQSVPLEGGRTATVDEAYIRDSILQPERDVVAGYEPIMPSYEGKLSDGEIQSLVAYIRHGTDRFDLIGSLNLSPAQNICAPGETPQDAQPNQTLRSPAMVPGAPVSGGAQP